VEDAEYEKQRKERMAGRGNIDEESFFNSETTGDDDLPELVEDNETNTQGDNAEESETQNETSTEEVISPLDLDWLIQRTEELRQRHEQQLQNAPARQIPLPPLTAPPVIQRHALPTALPRANRAKKRILC